MSTKSAPSSSVKDSCAAKLWPSTVRMSDFFSPKSSESWIFTFTQRERGDLFKCVGASRGNFPPPTNANGKAHFSFWRAGIPFRSQARSFCWRRTRQTWRCCRAQARACKVGNPTEHASSVAELKAVWGATELSGEWIRVFPRVFGGGDFIEFLCFVKLVKK